MADISSCPNILNRSSCKDRKNRDEPGSPWDEFKMAIAGPLASVGMAVGFFGVALLFAVAQSRLFFAAFTYLWFINLVLAVFNMLPIPPLDGGRVVANVLPPGPLSRLMAKIEPFGLFIVLGLLMTGVLFFLLSRPIGMLQDLLLGLVGAHRF